ncbi:UbiH/UbiF/VisC/COQ6 family ubiquinone biosynthesis hydroxylase [uncultured Oxalicibacterium sp.]|uniref:UbiH/UbiF/VisC/COQ6 family ubiquinone biosynthesis hydroxylase n=1 Tax=uncultured Oxalicibacterium sp. TaxID=1168540 RepID=UPI0025FDD210|nr:UbiH/UbiF/VisC/COQ6 family ubiquinone biosynthesis hydroxylase [uncultured Oxalicibacterium sp.]
MRNAPQTFDIAICGAGPVGLALAALLIQQGQRAEGMALIDARPAAQAMRDPRSIALSWGSRQILEQIAAWPAAATAIEQIHVSRRGHFGRTMIDRADYGLPALGYVLRYGSIVETLENRLAGSALHVVRPASVIGMTETGDGASIELADQPAINTRIVIQAEGGIFGQQEKKTLHRDYHQSAVVAHIKVDEPVAHRAFERFCDEGPLALLPQDDGYALVWCVSPQRASYLLTLEDAKFLAELEEAFGTRLGRFIQTSARHAFPLGLNAQVKDRPRSIAIGNAAQTLHPVAGQGLNLGLRDAHTLSRLLREQTPVDALASFSATRKNDRSLTIHLTDLMARIFAGQTAGKVPQSLLGLSLGMIDGIRPAKKLLAQQMMFGQRS